jgi:NADH:ubiquinone oxidoreductase subunit 6 (subunit J)
MDLHSFLFWLTAAMTGVCAVAVVVTQNIVRAATWLLFALAGTAGIFFLLGADFVGATQLLVYVGGTLVLVVFGVMLTAQGPFITMKTGAAEWAVALVVGALLYGVLAATILAPGAFSATAADGKRMSDPETSRSSVILGQALLGIDEATPPGMLTGTGARLSAERLNRTRMNYFLPFEIVSVHLLVVLIGAAYLARAKRRQGTVA